jgi:ribonuclease BN (tRNA processing enzyme)
MKSTILIHEATMADDQVAMADEKAHSTIGQAMDIAKRYVPVAVSNILSYNWI